MDEQLFRSVLGDNVSVDDLNVALMDMITAAEFVMLRYRLMTDVRPLEVIRQITARRQKAKYDEPGE